MAYSNIFPNESVLNAAIILKLYRKNSYDKVFVQSSKDINIKYSMNCIIEGR